MNLSATIQLFTLVVVASLLALAVTPAFTAFLYRHRLGKQIRDTGDTPVFTALHAKKAGTPTMGGILIWGTMLVCLVGFWLLAKVVPFGFFHDLNFWSRSETYLPIGMFLLAALVGLIDDFFTVRKSSKNEVGLRGRHRLLIYMIIAAIGAWWFVAKLDWTTLHIPFYGNFDIGWWYFPLFIFIVTATSHSVNLSDGLDGLAGGLLLAAFTAYAGIAVFQGKMELAGFIAVVIGALAAFLWFNISPARFWMGDTGAMGLGVTLGVIAMLTNTALLLPIIGFMFVIESGSVILQRLSKKLRGGKKLFLSSPIHHHFEAKGWPETKIVMRFWIISAMTALVGLIFVLVDKLK